MNIINVTITMQGYFCNEWPHVEIVGNNHIYFTGKVEEMQVIRFSIPEQTNNQIVIRHMNKRFGVNGVWDVNVNDNNEITSDRAVKLLDFELNSISIKSWIFDTCKFITTDCEQVQTDYFGYNGSITVDFDCPIYEWIICNCVKPKAIMNPSKFVINTTSDNLFNYTNDLKELDEIERILEQHAHLFS
jgi:hypothetical protein